MPQSGAEQITVTRGLVKGRAPYGQERFLPTGRKRFLFNNSNEDPDTESILGNYPDILDELVRRLLYQGCKGTDNVGYKMQQHSIYHTV